MSYLVALQSFEDTVLKLVGPLANDEQKNFLLDTYNDLNRLSGLLASPLGFVNDVVIRSSQDVTVHGVLDLIAEGASNCQIMLNAAAEDADSEDMAAIAVAGSSGLKLLREYREQALTLGFA